VRAAPGQGEAAWPARWRAAKAGKALRSEAGGVAPASASQAQAAKPRWARKQAPAHAAEGARAQAPRGPRHRPPPPSSARSTGLHATEDPLDLKSSVALVVDQDTNEVLFSKNPEAVLPIASITKLMTALVVTEAGCRWTRC
jgi:serine-type D-Ala-D-Ala endopeptidase (penicillin-binding protein 7)